MDDDVLVEMLSKSQHGQDPAYDIRTAVPDLTIDDSYRLGLKLRKQQQDDPIVGYAVSQSSAGNIAKARELGLIGEGPAPVFGIVSRSQLANEEDLLEVHDGTVRFVEAEIGVLMGRDLVGPNVSHAVARGAIEGFFAALDVASLSAVPSDERAFSEEHLYALNRAPIGTNQFASGQFIFGSKLTSPTIDLRTEGIVVSVNGKSVAAGVAWDLMGDPVNVVVATANHLAKYGECLRAGQLLVTGTPVWPPRVVPGETHTVRAEFTRLGSVSARFAS